jgi:hypothetical protein
MQNITDFLMIHGLFKQGEKKKGAGYPNKGRAAVFEHYALKLSLPNSQ